MNYWICRDCCNEFNADRKPAICAGCGGKKLVKVTP
jgi:DNA-directed RNA polymerase subunit RPC12/RpoP